MSSARRAASPMSGNIYLVGFAGVGKSSVGRKLATRLDRSFVDLDALVEEMNGEAIASIFSMQGEGRFRIYEHNALQTVSQRCGQIVATGGGVVLDERNRRLMQETGEVVFLDIAFEQLYGRLTSEDMRQRPLFGDRSKEQIAALYAERRTLYEQAPFHIDVGTMDADAVAAELEKILSQRRRR